jgi:hypothetical protein
MKLVVMARKQMAEQEDLMPNLARKLLRLKILMFSCSFDNDSKLDKNQSRTVKGNVQGCELSYVDESVLVHI